MSRTRKARFLRRALAEWPAILVTAMLLGFWLLLWPDGDYRARAAGRLPEPGAAYVNVDGAGSPLAMRPDRFAHPSGDGFRPVAEMPMMASPTLLDALPPPPYWRAGVVTGTVAHVSVPALALPPILVALESTPVRPVPAQPRTPVVRVSPPLQRVGFQFEEPVGLPPTGSVRRASFQLVLASDGRVVHLLTEATPDSPTTRAWRAAIARGTAQTAAVGRVEVDW